MHSISAQFISIWNSLVTGLSWKFSIRAENNNNLKWNIMHPGGHLECRVFTDDLAAEPSYNLVLVGWRGKNSPGFCLSMLWNRDIEFSLEASSSCQSSSLHLSACIPGYIYHGEIIFKGHYIHYRFYIPHLPSNLCLSTSQYHPSPSPCITCHFFTSHVVHWLIVYCFILIKIQI